MAELCVCNNLAAEHEHAMAKFSRTSKRRDSDKVRDQLDQYNTVYSVQLMHMLGAKCGFAPT